MGGPRLPRLAVVRRPRPPRLAVVRGPRLPRLAVVRGPRLPRLAVVRGPRLPRLAVVRGPCLPRLAVARRPRRSASTPPGRTCAVTPAPRAVVALAVLALAALVVPIGLVLLAVAALVAATIVDARAAKRVPHVERHAPEVLSRGVPAPLDVTARPPAGGSARVRQAAPAALALERREGEGTLRTSVTAKRRGRHVLPAVATRATGPLGLARWDHQPGEAAEVRVFPDLRTARRLAVAVARGRFRDQGSTARGPLGLGTEFELIRDYVPDDDIRQVNWRATARLGRPMSNHYRLEQDRDLLLLLDAGRLSAAPLDADGTTVLDVGLDAAAALAFVADELGDRTGAIAFDQHVRTALPPRRAGGQPVVRALFDLEPRLLDSDYELAFRRAEGSKRALVVVFCDLLEETAARPLIAAVPVLARRHAVIVASPSDPALLALAAPSGEAVARGAEPVDRAVPSGEARAAPVADRRGRRGRQSDALAAARATIARDVLDARARAAARVQAAGARVLEAPPDRLPAALVAAYLRAKSRAVF